MKDRKNSSLLSCLEKFQRLFFVALLSVLAVGAFAQSKTVSGTVLDKTGESVIGASVVVKGTTNGTITDFDGKFTLTNVPESGTIEISFVGYKTVNVAVKGQSTIKVILEEDTETLEEVVVVGYGVQKKSDVTGALTQVSSKTIRERPVQNALQAMQGKAAGVQITSNNRPGELGDVRIRGSRSLNASNDPLYVIDGIPMSVGSMADVNPNDIESMEILKDASATAIYGSRGANGVILITTKKGKTGKVTINYDGTVSFSKIHSMTDWMNSGELIDWNRQANVNAGAYTGKYGNAPDPDIDGDAYFGGVSQYPYLRPVFNAAFQFNADGTPVLRDATQYEKEVLGYADRVPVYNSANIPTTPWTDYVTRTSLTHNHQISLSAGTEKSKLYMSLAYLDQESPMKDQDYKRYTVNMNGEIQATEFLKVGMGINASHSIKNYGIVSNFSNTTAKDSYGLATSLMPYAPAFDENGKILSPDDGPSRHNVLLNIDEALNETRYYGFMLSSFAELDFGKIWTPLEGVKWRTNFGTQYRNSREGSYYGDKFTNPLGYASTEPNVAYNNHNQKLAWTLENMIFYNKTFNKIHTVGLTLMQSAEYYRTEGLDARAYESKFPTALWYSIGDSNKAKLGAGSSFNEQQRASYMARLNYNLMDRYLLTVTGRWDGASMLAAGNKWDFFPSAALAWKMNEENFMKNIGWLNSLKLRVGYGVTGNASINSYQTAGSMVSQWANKPFGQGGITTNTTGAKASVLPNRNLGWEKTASTNFGVDFGFLNNRITGSVEYYIANTSDLLLNRSIPLMTGYTQILTNVGKTQNKGLEITLSTTNIQTEDFTWKTDFTFSTNRSKIVELADGKVDDPTNGWFIGKPMDEIWTYKYDRLWQDTPEDRRMLAIYKGEFYQFNLSSCIRQQNSLTAQFVS
ncbi:SusC/RagA family TonB-linked outer membrane protein, partial [Phocaeicola vulgatus]|uniref:SusC/RagA family TonB-linked outer membrane protein n=1 Tax=Phocaeicola vulgatus TaxID=821 RepID=UPI003567FB18